MDEQDTREMVRIIKSALRSGDSRRDVADEFDLSLSELDDLLRKYPDAPSPSFNG